MRHTRFSLLAAFALFMTGCAYKPSFINEYKIDVQQGNVLTQDMVAQLKPGQTREQVRFILGSPLLTDVFHRERWDYVYYFRDGSTRKVQRRQFSVFFGADHRLSRVSGDVEVAATEELRRRRRRVPGSSTWERSASRMRQRVCRRRLKRNLSSRAFSGGC